MLEKIIKTDNSSAGPILRITLVVMMLPMGYLKIINFSGIMEILQTNYSLPMVIAFLVIVIEFFVPFFLLAGLGTRIGAALIGIVMFGAMFYHTQHGYYMNWYGTQEGEGIQLHLLAIGSVMALIVVGGGRWSLDGKFFHKWTVSDR